MACLDATGATVSATTVGDRYGRLVVVEPRGSNARGLRLWACRCDCGTVRVVPGNALRTGNTKSCGCARSASISVAMRRHGQAAERTREYASWRSMKARCYSAAHKSFADYGAVGISVCARWRDSFESFFADMGPRPAGTTLDRKDRLGNYEPENCRWATHLEQTRNRRNTKLLTIGGVTLAAEEWAQRTGVKRTLIYARLRLGWSDERAVSGC